jgi:plastocyanin
MTEEPYNDTEKVVLDWGIDRRRLLGLLGASALAGGAASTAAADEHEGEDENGDGNDEDDGNDESGEMNASPLVVETACGDDGGTVTIRNDGDAAVQARDFDDEGQDVIDGRPTLMPGDELTATGVPDGPVVVAAFDPETGEQVGKRVRVEVNCECTLAKCIHPELGYSTTGEDPALPVEPDHVVTMPIREPSKRPGEPEPNLDFLFDPIGLKIRPGDVVAFEFTTPEHSVTAYHEEQGRQRRIPPGIPPFTSPVLAAGRTWLYRFDTVGVYDILCAPHEGFGMVMRIVVCEDEVPEQTLTPPGRPPLGFAAVVLDDPMLTPENIVENGPIAWDDLTVIASGGGENGENGENGESA